MNICIYEPQEDSIMLEHYTRQYANGYVLDIGCGSGIQAITAAEKKNVKYVIAVDIQKSVVNYCKKHIKNSKIRFLQSDLFSKIKGKFNTIIFNPPYLPDGNVKDLRLDGGKKGCEIIEKFLSQVNEFLKPNGIILIIFSSLTKKEKIIQLIKDNLLEYEELEKRHFFFEDLYAYKLTKSQLLKDLENIKEIKSLKFFAKGHRSLVYKGIYKNKVVIVKCQSPNSKAINRISNEAKWLKILNKHNIAPKLLFAKNNFIVYGFVEGIFIYDYIKSSSKNEIRKVLEDILTQMRVLDKLKIDKEEMHHPYKHIIINKEKPILIDFERAHKTIKPKNVTQFCQFLMSNSTGILAKKSINLNKDKIIKSAKSYKSSQTKSNFDKILKLI